MIYVWIFFESATMRIQFKPTNEIGSVGVTFEMEHKQCTEWSYGQLPWTEEGLIFIRQLQSSGWKRKKSLVDAVDIIKIFLLCENHLWVQISFYIFVIANLESDGTRIKIIKKIFCERIKVESLIVDQTFTFWGIELVSQINNSPGRDR